MMPLNARSHVTVTDMNNQSNQVRNYRRRSADPAMRWAEGLRGPLPLGKNKFQHYRPEDVAGAGSP